MNYSTTSILREAVNFLPIIGNFTSYAKEKELQQCNMTDPKVERAAQLLKIANVVRSIATIALLVISVACPLFAAIVVPFWIIYCASDLLLAGWKLCNGDVSKILELGRAGVTAFVIGFAMNAMPFFAIGVEAIKLINRVVMLCCGKDPLKILVTAVQFGSSAIRKANIVELEKQIKNSPVMQAIKDINFFNRDENQLNYFKDHVGDKLGGLRQVQLLIKFEREPQFFHNTEIINFLQRATNITSSKAQASIDNAQFLPFMDTVIEANPATLSSLFDLKRSPYAELLRPLTR